jgi:adenylate cyclase
MTKINGVKSKILVVASISVGTLIAALIIYFNQKDGSESSSEKNANRVKSIAVLPFVNMSNDPSQNYYSDGLTDGILNSLAHLKGLKVSGRSSSFQFRGKGVDIKNVGAKLGVQTVLGGSLQINGDRIRITAQLINVEDGFHFWSKQFDENMNDIFSLQDKVANAIAKELEITTAEKNLGKADEKTTPNKEAYKSYLEGRSRWNLRTPPNLIKGIEFFRKAIELAPNYSAAYAGLADCYNALGYGSFMAPKEAFPKAKAAATRALELDSTLAEPHATLGFYKFYYDWDWAAAEQEFRIAIGLNPNYELGYDWYGYYLTSMKRYDEARIIFKKAKELDPLSVSISTDMGFSSYYSGDYDQARKELNASLGMNPKFTLAHIWLGRTFQAKKMFPEAIAEYKVALVIAPDWPVALAQIGNVYGVSGNNAQARKILDTLALLASKKYVTSYGVALVYCGLGETDKAFESLNKAYDERSHWLVWLKSDPRWVPIHSDKRFAELVHRVGLPD